MENKFLVTILYAVKLKALNHLIQNHTMELEIAYKGDIGHLVTRISTHNCGTAKLGNKERFDKEKLVLRNHFLGPICPLLHKDKELLALRKNFRVNKKFLIAKFDCIIIFSVH